jgi:hypothetical protein
MFVVERRSIIFGNAKNVERFISIPPSQKKKKTVSRCQEMGFYGIHKLVSLERYLDLYFEKKVAFLKKAIRKKRL